MNREELRRAKAAAKFPFIFRVHRTKIDGQTVDVRLEPFADNEVPIHLEEGDEFVTGFLTYDPRKELNVKH